MAPGPKAPAMSWKDVDTLNASSAPMRRVDRSESPFGRRREDPKAFRPMTLEDHLRLAQAPKLPGTRVTKRSYDALLPARRDNLPVWPDHQFVEYDDGQEQFIYRGGPSWGGLKAQVDPARESPDYGRGTRVLDQHHLPGVTARQAIGPAIETADRINDCGVPYGVVVLNSNSAVGELDRR